MDQKYIDYFLKTDSNVGQLDTLEISHPSFTQTYFLVRNHLKGFTATLEDGRTVNFQYVPMQIGKSSVKDDLDQTIDITLGDVGELIGSEIDNVERDNTYSIKPVVTYRTFQSNILNKPLFGPFKLKVTDFQFTKSGCSFQAKADSLNVVKTGELYDLVRFPMLRGVV